VILLALAMQPYLIRGRSAPTLLTLQEPSLEMLVRSGLRSAASSRPTQMARGGPRADRDCGRSLHTRRAPRRGAGSRHLRRRVLPPVRLSGGARALASRFAASLAALSPPFRHGGLLRTLPSVGSGPAGRGRARGRAARVARTRSRGRIGAGFAWTSVSGRRPGRRRRDRPAAIYGGSPSIGARRSGPCSSSRSAGLPLRRVPSPCAEPSSPTP
jgi:hypothetical protein